MSKPLFWTSTRDGATSLWVDWGEGPYNIWDIDPERATSDVLSAVMSAFQRGIECQYEEQRKVVERHVGAIDGFWSHKEHR